MSGLEEISLDTDLDFTKADSNNVIKSEKSASDAFPGNHTVPPSNALQDLDLLMDPHKSKSPAATPVHTPVPTENIPKLVEEPSTTERTFQPIKKSSFKVFSRDKIDAPETEVKKATIFDSLNTTVGTTHKEEDSNISDTLPTTFGNENSSQNQETHTFTSSGPSFSNTPSSDDVGMEKQELLFKLKRFEMRGIPLSRKFSLNSSVQDMREEFLRIKAQRDIENSVRFQRKTMMAFISGVEFLNSKFDPFDIKLDGWSESVHENLSDYDEVFEELHEKYKTRTKMAPEIKLLMMLGGSAVMFHMTNSLFKNSMPGVEDILKQNPDLMRQFATAAVHSANGPQNAGLSNVMEDMIYTQPSKNSRSAEPSRMRGPSMEPRMEPRMEPPSMKPPSMEEPRMQGPSDSDVDHVLNQIQQFRQSAPPEKTFDIPETVSEAPSSTSTSVRRRRGRPKNEDIPTFQLNI